MKKHRNLYLSTVGLALMLTGILFFSCNNDFYTTDDTGKENINICFGVQNHGTVAETKSSGKRSEAKEYAAGEMVLRGNDTAHTLCVQTTISDDIELHALENNPVTRAAPVTDIATTYGAFGVFAYVYIDGATDPNYYMYNEKVKHQADYWASENVYYWPGENHQLQFYAYAPYDCAGITLPVQTSPTAPPTLNYIVPSSVADQKDVMVATTDKMIGNANTQVPLTFKHICSAVRFVVGNDIQPGTITKITLKGVYGSGSYSMNNHTWNNLASAQDFTQELNVSTDNGAPGMEITPGEATFMMIPQILPENAAIEVAFYETATGATRVLTGLVVGNEWPIGKTVTYKVTISGDYELIFTAEPEEQDAHYVMYPITIKATRGWTISSNQGWLTLRTDLTDLQQQGYWIVDDRGSSSISSSTTGDNITVYAFLEENIGTETRTATLTLHPTGDASGTGETFTVAQLCPSWNGNLGCERIEENGGNPCPWGFNWIDDVTYQENVSLLSSICYSIASGIGSTNSYMTIGGSSTVGSAFSVEIKYSDNSINKIGGKGQSTSDGLANTREMYIYNGIGAVNNMEVLFDSWGITKTVTNGGSTAPHYFATGMSVLKNKFSKREYTANSNGVTETRSVPVIAVNDIVWFLPSTGECSLISDTKTPLSGTYWTSTAAKNTQEAYVFTSGGTTSAQERMTLHKIRACRKK